MYETICITVSRILQFFGLFKLILRLFSLPYELEFVKVKTNPTGGHEVFATGGCYLGKNSRGGKVKRVFRNANGDVAVYFVKAGPLYFPNHMVCECGSKIY